MKEVCAAFGIPIERGNFIKLRLDENTASTKLYLNKGSGHDRFYDFGSHIGGDCINLVQEYTRCSWQDAIEAVADAFGIQPVNNFDYEQRGVLTDRQWAKLGVYGDMVSKNLDFDLERFSPESAAKYAAKYRMPVNELREKQPKFYIAAILRNRAFPHVYDLRNGYYMQIHSEQSLHKQIAGYADQKFLSDDRKQELEKACRDLVSAEKLLKMALRGTDVRFTFREYNLEKDWEDVLQGKISFEVGPTNNIDIKKYAQKNNLELMYAKISEDEYFALPSDEVPHAAFLKRDSINLVYTSREAEQIEKMFGISQITGEKVSENKPIEPVAQPEADGLRKNTDDEIRAYDKNDNIVASWRESDGVPNLDAIRQNIAKVVVPAGATAISDYAFVNCTNLEEVIFEENSLLKALGSGVFCGCSSLTSVEIPASVVALGENVFLGCCNLTEISVPMDNVSFESIDGNLYNKGATTLIQYAAGKPDSAFIVPISVVEIGDWAFGYAENLKSVSALPGVTTIGSQAFTGCSNLESVELPTSAVSVAEDAFSGCKCLIRKESLDKRIAQAEEKGSDGNHSGAMEAPEKHAMNREEAI